MNCFKTVQIDESHMSCAVQPGAAIIYNSFFGWSQVQLLIPTGSQNSYLQRAKSLSFLFFKFWTAGTHLLACEPHCFIGSPWVWGSKWGRAGSGVIWVWAWCSSGMRSRVGYQRLIIKWADLRMERDCICRLLSALSSTYKMYHE